MYVGTCICTIHLTHHLTMLPPMVSHSPRLPGLRACSTFSRLAGPSDHIGSTGNGLQNATYWRFHKLGIRQNRWFRMDNPKMQWMMTGGSPTLGNLYINGRHPRIKIEITWPHVGIEPTKHCRYRSVEPDWGYPAFNQSHSSRWNISWSSAQKNARKKTAIKHIGDHRGLFNTIRGKKTNSLDLFVFFFRFGPPGSLENENWASHGLCDGFLSDQAGAPKMRCWDTKNVDFQPTKTWNMMI